MVELRKRKTPPPSAPASKKAAPAKKRASSKSASATPAPAAQPTKQANDAKETKKEQGPATAAAASSSAPSDTPSVGNALPLEELKSVTVQTNDGADTTLPALLEKNADKGIAIFTYPKASTPGCTNQACLFRDSYEELTASFEVYGLSNDSAKSNTNFKEKQKLPYTLLCDPKKVLLPKLGFNNPSGGAKRGVIVVDKEGKVRAWTLGGPQATLDAVKAVANHSEEK